MCLAQRARSTTKQFRSLHYLVEKLVRVGHLRQYIHSEGKSEETSQSLATTTPITSATPRVVINCIHGGPVDEEYNFKQKRQRIILIQCIMGCTWMHDMKAIPSTYHQMYPTEKDPPVTDPLQTIQISGENDHFTYASSLLESNEVWGLERVLQRNKDVFKWAHSNMPEIHLSIASHWLNVLSSSRLVRQKVQRFHPNRQKIIQTEIDKLLAVGFIREVEYPDWLANMIVVPKKRGK
ncbi:hypothetical protein CK203_028439 [Vitis vinifera]|uniref:Uncharacterized protein n=1 Tax=Vitis vinifera TaxID=29760 RepID=A0A438J011_VITVI|nr:hypothetical protein CK203_028439 [Vitis vinifera]